MDKSAILSRMTDMLVAEFPAVPVNEFSFVSNGLEKKVIEDAVAWLSGYTWITLPLDRAGFPSFIYLLNDQGRLQILPWMILMLTDVDEADILVDALVLFVQELFLPNKNEYKLTTGQVETLRSCLQELSKYYDETEEGLDREWLDLLLTY